MNLKETLKAFNRRKLRKQEEVVEEKIPTPAIAEETASIIETAQALLPYAHVMETYYDPMLDAEVIVAKPSATTTLEARVPAGTTVINAGGFTVYDATGKPRMRMGVWEEAQAIPEYNESTQEVEQSMDFTNADTLSERLLRDKAIIAMHIIRVTKPAGNAGKGMGPNREDHPLFKEVVHMWLDGKEITGAALEKVETARSRVAKYGRQLDASDYRERIMDTNMSRGEFINLVNQAYKTKADAELAEALKEETYGGW